jgi:hypothetical protein
MSHNLSANINYNLSQEMPSFVQLLDLLGFTEWQVIIATFVLPSINFVGLFFSTLSAWIFFREKFKDPVFFYFRLLCLTHIIHHLIHNIPSSLLYIPRYFPKINTNYNSLFRIYYGFSANFLFHFEETLHMGILLMRMRIFIPFVRRHFTALPRIVSLILFCACLCINLPIIFSQQVRSFGSYYIFDESNGSTQYLTYYYVGQSDFSATLWGKFLVGFVGFTNLVLSLVVGFILNIVSFLKYKLYLKAKREKLANSFDLAINLEIHQVTPVETTRPTRRPVLTQKEINENKAEKNMFLMALTLCSISLVSRVLLIICAVLFLFFLVLLQ